MLNDTSKLCSVALHGSWTIPAEVPCKMHLALIDSDSLPGCLPFERRYFSTVRSTLHIPWLWTVWIDQGFFMQSLSCTLVILHSHWEKHHCMNVFVYRGQSFVLYAGREREKLVLSDRPLWHMPIFFQCVACISSGLRPCHAMWFAIACSFIIRWS